MPNAASSIYLAEITVHTGISTRTLRYSSADGGYITLPTDTPANTLYDPRLVQPALLRRDIFERGHVGGQSRQSYGELLLSNKDGGLDALFGLGFDGRPIRILLGAPGASLSTFEEVFVGLMDQPEYTTDHLVIRIRDEQTALDKPLQATKYAGTNVLPDGLEGVPEDIAGHPKPLLFGICRNVSPVLVNTSRLIYQLHDGTLTEISAVYDRGAALGVGAPYASQADMETNAPAAGEFRPWLAAGCFRLGSLPTGAITADATEGATAADRTTAQVFRRVLERAGKTSADLDLDALTALDTLAPGVVGLFYAEEVRVPDVLDRLANGVGAWWGASRTGLLKIEQLRKPEGSPVAQFVKAQVMSLARQSVRDDGHGVPTWRVVGTYQTNYTVQTSDLAGVVTADRRAWLAAATRRTKAEDTSVRTKYLLAQETERPMCFDDAADADAETLRVLRLLRTLRNRFEVRVRVTDADLLAIDLGKLVRLTYDRYGLQNGQLMRVLGVQADLRLRELSLTLWGGNAPFIFNNGHYVINNAGNVITALG